MNLWILSLLTIKGLSPQNTIWSGYKGFFCNKSLETLSIAREWVTLSAGKKASIPIDLNTDNIKLNFNEKEKKLDPASWKSLNKIARHCLKIDY